MSNVTIRHRLLSAIDARDADGFERALASAFEADVPHDVADVLIAALSMPWHTRHEDLASALQTLKVPEAVDALYEAAFSRHEYLNYDEFFGLARKCTWALADIGTSTARARLEQIAASPNSLIAGYARKRLECWQVELGRKGQ